MHGAVAVIDFSHPMKLSRVTGHILRNIGFVTFVIWTFGARKTGSITSRQIRTIMFAAAVGKITVRLQSSVKSNDANPRLE